jgi:type II secretory pathway pseudopilin PulG
MRRRNAFTIVELLVAMALIMFIMAILSTAFVTATTTFRNLKAIGDMANKLRSVTTLLQRDLAADHFEGKKRLSNPNFWINGPPTQGYFRVWQGSAPGLGGNITEGTDSDVIGSYRSVDHMLAFTIKLRGDQMGDFLTAGVNGGGSTPLAHSGTPPKSLSTLQRFGPTEARYQMPSTFNYQWGEVAWYLYPQIDPQTSIQDTTSGGIPLWVLYRNQRLAVPDNNLLPPNQPATSAASFLEMSCWANTLTKSLYFNSPMDLTMPYRRFGMNPSSPAGIPTTTAANGLTYPPLANQGAAAVAPNLVNADIQATDVVSFDVRLLVSVSVNPATGMAIPANLSNADPTVSLFNPIFNVYRIVSINGAPKVVNPAFYNATSNPTGPAVFDTWSSIADQLTGSPGYSAWSLPGHLHSIPLWNPNAQSPVLPAPIILAIQITIRVWDLKTEQTREVTIIQAM